MSLLIVIAQAMEQKSMTHCDSSLAITLHSNLRGELNKEALSNVVAVAAQTHVWMTLPSPLIANGAH